MKSLDVIAVALRGAIGLLLGRAGAPGAQAQLLAQPIRNERQPRRRATRRVGR